MGKQITAAQRKVLDRLANGEKVETKEAETMQESGLLVWESYGTAAQRLVPSALARVALAGADLDAADTLVHGDGEGSEQGDKG